MAGRGGARTHRVGRRLLLGAVSLILALLAWQGVATFLIPRLYGSYAGALFPTPGAVLGTGAELVATGELIQHTWASLRRVLVGVGLVVITAIPLGLAVGSSSWFRALAGPPLELIRPISPLAWIPLTLIWFGVSDLQNVSIVFITAFFPLLLNTIAGVRNVERSLTNAALTLGAERRQLLRYIVLPAALPYILTGIRLSLGLGWVAIVAAELVGAVTGLGALIEDSRSLVRSDRILLSMAAIGLMGAVLDQGLRAAQRRLLPWSPGGRL